MRIACNQMIIALGIACVSYAHNGHGQQVLEHRVTAVFQQTSLEDALNMLEKQTSVKFVYSRNVVNTDLTVSLEIRKASLKKVLDKLLTPYGIDYHVVNDRIVLNKTAIRKVSGEIVPENPNSHAPLNDAITVPLIENYVSGKVTDERGAALPGVSIILKGTQKGTITDAGGSYELAVPDGKAILIFSFVGYISQEVETGNRTSIDVSLKVDEKALEEVVVVGYGTQSRETLTTSVSKLDNKVLENIPYANAASALQGTLSGVRVQSVSGQPGAAPRVIIRGGTSINSPNAASPLYIIDGVIRTDMNHISTEDIKSIQVLKDAASTSIYGARGSNGVVIIVTKSGTPGATTVSYNFSLTASDINRRYDLLSARDFIHYKRLAVQALVEKIPERSNMLTDPLPAGTGNDLTNNTGFTTQYLSAENQHKLSEGWESMPDPLDPSKTIIFKESDIMDRIFRTGISQNHSISASGGTENATFNIGLGYLNNQGIAINTDYKRISLNLNGDVKVRDNLKVFGRLLYSNTSNNGVAKLFNPPYPDRNEMFSFLDYVPTSKYRNEDGSFAHGLSLYANPEYAFSTQDAKNTISNLTMVVGSRWDILPGLAFEPQVSLFNNSMDGRFFQKAFNHGGPLTTTRAASGSYSKQLQYQADAVFSYTKSFEGDHNLDIKAGFSYFDIEHATLNANGRGAASDLIPTLNASAIPVSVTSTETHQVVLGYFSRINYDFKQKYLLSVNARYDAASNLGAENKWGFFPGASLGWNVHKEDFWKVLPEDLMNLKLRASYGVNGNISGLGPYQAQGEYRVGATYSNMAGIQNTTIANENLQWERSRTIDFGIDLGAFNNRVSILFDYYRRVTDNLLTNYTLPPSTGFAGVLTNLGSLENKGVELELQTRLLPSTSDFKWDVSFNAARVKNKILKLPDNGTENNRIGGVFVWDPKRGDYAWLGGLQEGGTMGDLFAYKQIGVYPTDEDAAAGPVDMIVPGLDKTKYGGDVNFLDSDGNGVINDRDRVYVGNIYPKWTGGVTSFLSYKQISLYIRMDYTTGHTIDSWTRALFIGQVGDYAMTKEITKAWQKQGDITDIPRIYQYDQLTRDNIWRKNSYYFEKGDFLNLREVSLSYNVPRSLLRKIRVNGLSFNLTGNSLYYFTRYKGLNPEEGGVDNGRYPNPRTFIFGAKISI